MKISAHNASFTAFATALALSCSLASARLARADDTTAKCADAYELAQREHGRGAFLEATQAAQTCSQIECNTLLAQECIKLLEQFRAEVPTMVFSAHSGRGEELSNVRVQIDGKWVSEHLDGMALAVNPGPHTFRFEMDGADAVEVKHTARVGEKNHLIDVVLGKPPPPAPKPVAPSVPVSTPPPLAPAPAPAPEARKAKTPVASYVLGGAGILGLGAFGYLRFKATSDYNDLNHSCSPRCNPDEVDKIHTKFQLSYVGLGIGVAGLGAAALVYAISNNSSGAPTTEVAVIPGAGGASAELRTFF